MEIGHTRTYLWTTYNCFTFLFISWVYRVGSLEWSILSTHRDGLVMSEDTSFLRGFSSVQFSSAAQLCPTLCDPVNCSTPGFPVLHYLLEFAQTYVHWVSDTIQPSHPLSSPSPSAPNPPSIRVFSNEWVLRIRWPKNWSFCFSINPSNEYSGLISFRIDWLDLLAVQGTLKSSPSPQFKSIHSSALSFLYGPTLTSILDYWKNHSFD